MGRRIAYTGDPVLSVAEVAYQCRLEPEDVQEELISGVIIPGVTAQAEALTGAGIRAAEYEDCWPEHYRSGHALDVGQAKAIVSISRVHPDGALELLDVVHRLRVDTRESFLFFPDGRPEGELLIRYTAGVDLECYPAARTWLLMSAATAHEFRETLVSGVSLAQLPAAMIDSLLSEITVPPRF